MKCEHCGKNEVTFVYRSNWNGQVEEKHLCAECAGALGYTQRLAAQNRSMMQNFFGRSGLLGGSFLEDFFTPMPNLLGRMLENPFDDFFAEMPALGTAPAAAPAEQTPKEEPQEPSHREEPGRFSRMREMNALRLEMKKAVHQENFERAAEIRDQLRRMEAERKA